ncbi:hypothetical protein [Desulfobotulus mexicanus]|uniref:Uncharacterized protein n=1 Tax=Desulfobotulus mexicanus TaxID=2586642 RepID=A0A5S5MDU6_9BACT|nr:hypothetical protein [Desulfobotulus mexicanus]TYT73874.1 hypothetical protein FIM25_12610 [Desulfobotulus mexicanus]
MKSKIILLHTAICLLITLACMTILPADIHAVQKQKINTLHRFAWSETSGWINFRTESGTATIYKNHLEGYIWGENVGWIRLGTHTGGGSHSYLNDSAATYGVNRSDNRLSGYAWGENIGWINFGPLQGGVSIDPATGNFTGLAWSESIGWISLAGTAQDGTAYRVKTGQTEYTVSTSAGKGGKAAPSEQTVSHGESALFSILADTGYTIDTVNGCGGTLSGATYTTAGITAPCTVNAFFMPLPDILTVESGTTFLNNSEQDGIIIEEGGTVLNNGILSSMNNQGTVNGGSVSGTSFNSGLLAQSEIMEGSILHNAGGTVFGGINRGSLFGGKISGNYENRGHLSGTDADGQTGPDNIMTITQGAEVHGGDMAGELILMGLLRDLRFSAETIIFFPHWSEGGPGRLAGQIIFKDSEGLVTEIRIPDHAVFPDPESITESGLRLNLQNLSDYAQEKEWNISERKIMQAEAEESIPPLPLEYHIILKIG